MSKSYTLNRDAIFFFFGVGRVKVKIRSNRKTKKTLRFKKKNDF
jgi:hypothetical protein